MQGCRHLLLFAAAIHQRQKQYHSIVSRRPYVDALDSHSKRKGYHSHPAGKAQSDSAATGDSGVLLFWRTSSTGTTTGT
jgi:hypothetical protein